MRRSMWLAAVILATTAVAPRADVWDIGVENDNDHTQTRNELIHGSDQWHDLSAQGNPAAPDADWYRIGQSPYASYEILVDSLTGGLQPGLQVDLVEADGSTVVRSGSAVSALDSSLRLTWQNGTPSSIVNQYVRVAGAACGTSCTTGDVYRIRVHETTYSIPRFNNGITQSTVLIVQNPRPYGVTGTAWFWKGDGTLLAGQSFTLAPRATFVLGTAGVAALAGQAGSITVTHDAGYGGLAGKAVATEPSTGFSFDTPMVPLAK